MQNTREIYLDILKGIAILLVVMKHTGNDVNSNLNYIFNLAVPVFFLVSGYLAYKTSIDYKKEIIKKLNRLALPFIIATSFAAIWYNIPIDVMLLDIGKHGYWFLETLFIIFLIYYVIHKLKLTITLGIIFEILFLFMAKYGHGDINNIFGFSYIARYFPCFMVGSYIKEKNVHNLNKFWYSLILICSCLSFVYANKFGTNLNFILNIFGYTFSSVFIYYFVYELRNSIPLLLSKGLEYIGKKSLSIYIIHFYYLVQLFQTTKYFTSDLIVILIYSIFTILLCIITSEIIKNMTILSRIF